MRTLSRDRAKDMASDYADTSTERRGWARPGSEMSAPSSELVRDPEQERRLAARAAFQRHAQAVSAMFRTQESGLTWAELNQLGQLAALTGELREARRGPDALDPNYVRDVERAYRSDPELAHEAADGTLRRAVQALRLEAELRAIARAEAFVERWRHLDARSLVAYQSGDVQAERRLRNTMGEMARSLQRDPQLESIPRRQEERPARPRRLWPRGKPHTPPRHEHWVRPWARERTGAMTSEM